MPIPILLADDHQMVREGLRTLLAQQDGFEVIGEATDGWSTVRLVKELAPEIVIMDVAMPGLNGIEATRQVCSEMPGTRVIALSVHGDKRFVAEMLKAGASGYVLKGNAFDQLVRAIQAVSQGHVYLCPEVAGVVVEGYLDRIAMHDASVFSVLTAREREIMQLLAEGKSTKDIAAFLYISQKTVDVHRQNIMAKLQLQSLADLVKYAIKEGLVSLDS